MVWKLLRKNISALQIAGYALANLIGLAIVISAVKFYGDVQSAWQQDSFISKDYLIISKTVSTLNTIGISRRSTTFSDSELADLEQQPWVKQVAAFTGATFNVSAAIDLRGLSLSTFMFLESIPDDCLDVTPDAWHFSPGDDEVPIIVSKDYLSLYNFGFATSRGLPQLSEGAMSAIPFNLIVSGRGHAMTFKARIVGFSSRLNTIAVPMSFMTWANSEFGSAPSAPSRLIVEVNKPGDPAIDRYMSSHGYEIAGDKADNSRASYFLTLTTTIVIAVGIVISLLALFILLLSIHLLLQKNRQKLHDLMLLGYSPHQVSRPYYTLVTTVNAAILVLGIIIMLAASAWWGPRLQEIGVTGASPLTAIAIGVVIIATVTAVNIVAIRRTIRSNFYNS